MSDSATGPHSKRDQNGKFAAVKPADPSDPPARKHRKKMLKGYFNVFIMKIFFKLF